MNTWTFDGMDISFTLERYVGGAPGVQAWEHSEGPYCAVPYARISVNIPEVPRLPEGQFYLKHWQENDAIASAMLEQGLIEQVQPPVLVSLEFGIAFACQFTEKGSQFCH